MSPGEPSFSTGRGAGRRSDRWNRRGGVDIASDLRTVELRRPRRRAKCGESSSCATHVGRISEGPRNSKLLQSDRYDKLERMRLPESACKLVESNALAHLVTLNPDGSPQVTCIWVGLDDGEIVSGHLSADQQKLKNVARDPRVALSIEGTEMLPPGLKQYLVLHGRARLEEGGAPELLQRLAHVYLGPGVRFPPMDDPPPGQVMRITVERIGGVGPWID
jgi:PPOX class probable F420-dependent enzyme